MAVGEGFEPSNPFWGLRDFESRAFDHSAIPPRGIVAIGSGSDTVFFLSLTNRFDSFLNTIKCSAKNQIFWLQEDKNFISLREDAMRSIFDLLKKLHLQRPKAPLQSLCFTILSHSYELRRCVSNQGLPQEAGHDDRRRFPGGRIRFSREGFGDGREARQGQRPRYGPPVRSLRSFR